MKPLLYLSALLVLLTLPLQAQPLQCPCTQALKKLVLKVEREYPGFSSKTKDSSLYQSLKQTLHKQAKGRDAKGCPRVLKAYTDFFKDPHLWVGANGTPFAAATRTFSEKLTIDLKEFEKNLQTTSDSLEGVYTMPGYKVGLKKTPANEYIGFILESASNAWRPKDIKFKLLTDGSFTYALMDRSIQKGQYQSFYGALLFLEQIQVVLTKQTPKPRIDNVQIESRRKELEGFYFKKVSEKTSVLRLPSFEYQHLETINQLLTEQTALLESSQNLIIDLRGNPGGTTDAYQKLLPYISGKFIRHTGVEFLATQTYINNLETYKKSLGKDTPTQKMDQQIQTLKANLGRFVNFTSTGKSFFIDTLTVALKSPQQIVILANKSTGSSAEYFLFIAKQSKKVKVLGTPSYGALDYGNAYLIDFDCPPYQLFMPTYRALRLPDYPIDNIGIQPDVYLDPSIRDWVAFARDYLEQ
ncbi:S41 family peptidase [Siphonobacter sp.]|uniref:S41 family peptidase n=1 Tax=Siphonobacter sp. TaxID=1869184 RepID=UPI003B3A177F